jgi:hypothetical protein
MTQPSMEELRAEAVHSRQRAALYRRKILIGRGESRRLDELDRIAAGAAARLKAAIADPSSTRGPSR